MDRLLLLLPTTSYRVADFLAAAGRLGVEVIVGSNEAQVLAAFSKGGTLTLDFKDLERGCCQILELTEDHPPRAVVGVDEATCTLAAKACAALGLTHNPVAAMEAAADKHRQRLALQAAGLPLPDFQLIEGPETWRQMASGQRYPCVLKPLALSASRGVLRADSPAAFLAAAKRIAAILGDDRAPILVEGYIPGFEVALEGLMQAGRLTALAQFDKPDPMEGPTFEESLYITPSRLAPDRQAAVLEMAQRAADALGLTEGPVHAEFRLNDRGVWPLEIAARTIGGLCARSLSFGAGVSLEDLVLRHALGLPIESLAREARAAGVMMIPIPKAGLLKAVTGQDQAAQVPGIVDLTIAIPPGQELVPLPEGDKYLGFIFAKAKTPDEVEAALRSAHRLLRFDIA